VIKKSLKLAGAAFFVAPAAALLAAGPAMAASAGDVVVSNTETVQAYLDASGKVDVARVYEQVAMQGKGSVDLVNPVETKGLRNLDGFGGFDVKDGNMVGTYQVDGEKRLRSVSDYTKKLPLEVEVKYTLDGKAVRPGDVVGKSGLLKVQYTVRNVTGQPQDVSFNDGTGKTATASEDVVIPMVGSLSTVLPSNFTDVQSGEANMAGDGHGGTKISFTMTLFGPIGKPEATFGYQAKISDGVIPKASISALPVSPLDSPSFKGGAESYKGGAETGATLTAGATEIDSNLLKLRDGAGDLLAGLIKLRDGAGQLNAGLAGEAAPGAAQLAEGANKLKGGTSQLSAGAKSAKDGADQVSGGANQVADGATQLATGSAALASGSGDLAAGAADLADGIALIKAGVEALPTTVAQDADFKRLQGALAGIQVGIGSPTDATSNTLLGGLNLLKYGLRSPLGVASCDQDPTDDSNTADNCGAADGASLIGDKLGAAAATGGDLDKLIGAAKSAYDYVAASSAGTCPPRDPSTGLPPASTQVPAATPCYAASSVVYGLALPANANPAKPEGGLKAQTALAAAKLSVIVAGLDTQAIPGIERIKKGLSNPGCDPDVTDKSDPKFCGVAQAAALVSAGVDTLVQTIADTVAGYLTDAADGADQVADGASQVADGAGLVAGGTADLADGAGQLADGAGQLDSGLGTLSAGAGELDNGAGQLNDGAAKLSSGLKDAADGSGQLKDGLDQAAAGAPKIKDGAQQLSDQGTKKLIEAGKSTAADYGQKYALIEAGAKRAQTEGMAYGAPADAAGQTAYSYELAGADGEGGRNLGRGLGAAVVLALGAGVGLLRRKVV